MDLGHCIERIQYVELARKLGGRAAASLAEIGTFLFTIGYADHEEADADRQGVIYAEQVGYHPQAGQLVFARLRAQVGEHPMRRATLHEEVENMVAAVLENYFATHPPAAVRIANYLGHRNRTLIRF